jgi:hypothetical protein
MKMFIPSSEKIGTNVEDSKPLVLTIDESKLYQEPFREMLFGMAVDASYNWQAIISCAFLHAK